MLTAIGITYKYYRSITIFREYVYRADIYYLILLRRERTNETGGRAHREGPHFVEDGVGSIMCIAVGLRLCAGVQFQRCGSGRKGGLPENIDYTVYRLYSWAGGGGPNEAQQQCKKGVRG